MQGGRWHSDTEGIRIGADLFNNEDEAEAPLRKVAALDISRK
jgi:hypothetical protein